MIYINHNDEFIYTGYYSGKSEALRHFYECCGGAIDGVLSGKCYWAFGKKITFGLELNVNEWMLNESIRLAVLIMERFKLKLQ